MMWFHSVTCRLSAHENDLLCLSINEQTNDQWQIYPLLIILRKYREDFYYFWSNPKITRAFWFTVLAMDPCFQVIVKDSQRIFSFVAGQSSCSWWRRIKPTSLISDVLRTNCGRGKNRNAALGWKPPLPGCVTRHHLTCIELDDTRNRL